MCVCSELVFGMLKIVCVCDCVCAVSYMVKVLCDCVCVCVCSELSAWRDEGVEDDMNVTPHTTHSLGPGQVPMQKLESSISVMAGKTGGAFLFSPMIGVSSIGACFISYEWLHWVHTPCRERRRSTNTETNEKCTHSCALVLLVISF